MLQVGHLELLKLALWAFDSRAGLSSIKKKVFLKFSLCDYRYDGTHMWKSEATLQELVLFFCHVGPGAQTQVLSLGSQHLYLLSIFLFFIMTYFFYTWT